MNNKKIAQQRQEARPANQPHNVLPWRSLEQQVVRAQKQIAQASLRGDRQAVYDLQQRLMESEAARLLAVRRVAGENPGRDTAGVDGIKSLGLEERLAMASAIHPRNWNYQPPMPVRRVWVPKPDTAERRPLAILSMIDRCKQALVKLALEPEWEVKFEAHSYGFRPGLGVHDAMAAIVVAIDRQPMFVFDADIETAFDSVNQAALLDKLQTSHVLRQLITAWLRAGVMDGEMYAPSETGLAQGGVLSPLLMNIALHGMEAVATEGVDKVRAGERPLLVRYADDFVILHHDLKELQQAIRRVKRWLAHLGLHLHADKTRITHTLIPSQGQVGFDFLGFNIRQEQGNRIKTIIAPSQEAIKRHLATIDQRLLQLQTAPQARVIKELNPLVIGWVAYYNGVVPASAMRRFDELIEQRLLNWAGKRHPGKAREWQLNRYWQRVGGPGSHERVFAIRDGEQLRTYRQASILKGKQ